jgi:hypothetical protein
MRNKLHLINATLSTVIIARSLILRGYTQNYLILDYNYGILLVILKRKSNET